jgi:hypothetical protein
VQRIFGAIAIFAGWMSIPIGAMAGLITSEFFGLGHTADAPPIQSVYGLSGLLVLWIFAAAAVVTSVPLAAALVAVDPRRTLRVLAVVLLIGGAALLPDPLGRVFGLPLLPGAAFLWVGGDLVHRGAMLPESAAALSPAGQPPDSTAAGAATDPSPVVTPKPAGGPSAGRARRGSRGRASVAMRACPWCSTEVPAGVGACPNCGATLDAPAADEISIPGLTEVPPNLQRYLQNARDKKKRQSLLGMVLGDSSIPVAIDAPPPSDAAALRPPTPELKAEMARLDADIAAGAMPLSADGVNGAETAPDAPSAETPETPAAQ